MYRNTTRVFIGACLFILLAGRASAQTGCETIYLPEMNVSGVQTTVIETDFHIPPANGVGTYPFNVQSFEDGGLVITQDVGPAENRFRWWHGVKSFSLVFFSWRVFVVQDTIGNTYAQDGLGIWRPWKDLAQAVSYTILPGPRNLTVEPTWLYHEDFRADSPNEKFALSTPLNIGEGWNIGVFAPYGLHEANLQVKARLCR